MWNMIKAYAGAMRERTRCWNMAVSHEPSSVGMRLPMHIAMDALCVLFSKAFDIIETEQIGTSEHHSKRVAVLCSLMGRRLGFGSDAIAALATCALFHDNALSECRLYSNRDGRQATDLRLHCEYGQRNVSWLPFATGIDGFVLYHHECETGTGPFGKGADEFPLEAALIAATDHVDAKHHLQRIPASGLGALRDAIAAAVGRISTGRAMAALLDVLDSETLESLRDENIHGRLETLLPPWKLAAWDGNVIRLAAFIAHIIDYKSDFTRKHTEQIANRAWLMSGHYGYADEERAQLFLAAALHDIGKIATPLSVLEKPGALTREEFAVIRRHVRHTYDWLGEVEGLGGIRGWASAHHEKLDGSGYPLGLRAEDLDFNSRLLACIDIYQAVCEERPYHAARGHQETMPILYDMAGKGKLDAQIVKDLDAVMADWSLRDLPSPPL
jgi:HD-GYP domain-containing protein (c-di-GMP phosphodiesterase class II)